VEEINLENEAQSASALDIGGLMGWELRIALMVNCTLSMDSGVFLG
jgi:hypothetical protein